MSGSPVCIKKYRSASFEPDAAEWGKKQGRTVVSVPICSPLPAVHFLPRFGALLDVCIPNAQDAPEIQLAWNIQDRSAESSAAEFDRHDVDHLRLTPACEKEMLVAHRGKGSGDLLVHEISRGLVLGDAAGQREPHTEMPGTNVDFIAQTKSTPLRIDSHALSVRSLRLGVNDSIGFQIEHASGVRRDRSREPDGERHEHSFAGRWQGWRMS
jgi:hypothetical protein